MKHKSISTKRRLLFETFLFLVLLLFMQLISASTEEYKPYLHNPSVGKYPKLEMYGSYKTELFPGSATYNYEMQIPEGTNGLQPMLSLNYDSQSATQRPSILGSGWILTQNHIMRNVNHSIDNSSDDYFVLVLNGNQNKVLYSDGSFKTEIDPYFKIEDLTNNDNLYWLVTLKDGTKYRFGYNNDSRLDSNTGMDYSIKWSLDLIEDTHGNKVYYSYLEDPFEQDKGAVYISNITYNNDRLRFISFDYENQARQDRRLVYEQGNKLEESRRLENVYVYFNDSLVRRYYLQYDNLANPEKSLYFLSNITYYGSDGSSVLNSVGFEYYPSQKGFYNTTEKWIVPEVFSSVDSDHNDLGIRLVDVNNDGFVDFVKSRGGVKETRLNNKVNGWDSSGSFVMPEYITDEDNLYQGVEFADLNNDGLVDVLRSKGDYREVYFNNKEGWSKNTSWLIPVAFLTNDYKDQGVLLTDLNGDSKIDLLQAKESGSVKNAWINNGSGWESTSKWVSPDYFVTSDYKDTGLRIIDLNNDGLPDLVKGGEPGSAWINNGSGWENYSIYAPNLNFTSKNHPDLGVRFMDINGDQLVDMIQNIYSNISVSVLNETCFNETHSTENCTYYTYDLANKTNVKINNGSGWVYSSGWESPEKFAYNGYNTGRRIADVNGDGYADIVVGYQGSTTEKNTEIKNATNAFLINEIRNEYGGFSAIEYKPSTQSNNSYDLGFNLWLVSNVTQNNSLLDDFRVLSRYLYSYEGGKFDYLDSEFKGFNIVNETLPDNSTLSHYFHQDNVLKGREYRTELRDKDQNNYKMEIISYNYSSDNKIYLASSSSYVYDGDAVPFVTNVSYNYDGYGNIIQINNHGDINLSGDERSQEYNFVYNLSGYIVDKPSNYTIYTSNGTVVRRAWYYYDSLTGAVTKGDLTKLENYNNLGDNPETIYSYDIYGNLISETDPLNYETLYEYDNPTNTYIIKKTNELDHDINYEYDLATGNILSESRDGIDKEYSYDLFGRMTQEVISPDTNSSPTKVYTYYLDGLSPEMIKLETKNREGDYSEELYFYEGFSNLIQTKVLFEDKQIVKTYFYDNKSRIYAEQNPYFEDYSVNLSNATSYPRINYNYDPLDRVVNLTKQDNSAIYILFNKTSVTSFDENGNRQEYLLDSYDRIVNVYEYLNQTGSEELYNTSYSYDSSDQLVKITDSEGNNFTFNYDSLGRKIEMSDPNMKNWSYGYDLNGNLVNQTDGRNTTLHLEYDRLNRLKSKSSGEELLNFSYDQQYEGTLSNITLTDFLFGEVYYKYEYGSRLRVTKEMVYIQDQWINTSVDYDSSDRILKKYLPDKNLEYGYNNLGKIKNISGYLTSVNYNAFGSPSNKTYSNNLITEYNYDNLNRITSIETGDLQDLDYLYDSLGNIKSINDSINNKYYYMNYDSLNRLINTTINDDYYKYNYNPIANMMDYNTSEKNVSFKYDNLTHGPSSVEGLYFSNLSVNMVWPEENAYVNSDELKFVFNASEDSLCWLYIFDEVQFTEYNFSASVRKNTNITFYINSTLRDDKNYKWQINCHDYFDNSYTVNRDFTVDTSEIRICRDLTVENRPNYTLLNDVSSDGTCFNITVSNITLNGQGYRAEYGQSENGHGIYSQGNDNLSIRNLSLIINNPSAEHSHGIFARNGTNINITELSINTTCTTLSSDSSCNGVYLYDFDNSFINHININTTSSRDSYGIEIYSSSISVTLNHTISSAEINAYGESSGGIRALSYNGGVSDIVIENSSIYSGRYYGIHIREGPKINGNGHITIVGVTSMSNLVNRYALFLEDSETALVINSSFSSLNSYDVKSNTGNHTFLNVTYNNESVSSGSQLIRKWYYRAYVNDTNGNNVSNANVSAYNVTGNYQFNLTTDESGYTSITEIIDYINNGTNKNYYSNYTLYADNVTLSGSHIYNVTLNQNNLEDTFTLGGEDDEIIEITSCQEINEPGTYQLQNDITGITATCFTINANNIVLDMNGKNITGNISGNGVYINRSNSSAIKNGYIYGFSNGIYLLSGSYNNLSNNVISSNTNGILLSSASNNNLSNNIINDNSVGIYVSSSSSNRVINNSVNSGGTGIFLSSGSGSNNLINNTANSNSEGIYLASNSNNNLSNNIANENVIQGIHLLGSSGNRVINNTVNSNGRNGIYLNIAANNNLLANNSIWNCSKAGAYSCINVDESDKNIFNSNAINQSSKYGIWIQSAGNFAPDNADNNTFMNTNLTNINSTSVFIDDDGSSKNTNNTFINMSYNNETVDSRSQLVRKWYYQAYVNDSSGNAVSGAYVTGFNVSGALQFNFTTNSSGWINRTEVIEYVNTGTPKYYSLYTLYADNITLSDSHSYNVTLEKNNLNDIFTLS